MRLFMGCRLVFHVISAVGLLVALCFCIAAIITPGWQIVNYHNLGELHHHGLWENCILGGPMGKQMGKEDEWVCTFRSEPQVDLDPRYRSNMGQDTEHDMQSWHMTTLGLLGASIFFGVIAVVCAFISATIDFCQYRTSLRVLIIVWVVCHCFAGVMAGIAMILFVRFSYDTKNRFILQITVRYEQVWGYSFWHGVTSCVIYVISIIFAIVTLIITYAFVARQQHEYVKVHKDELRRYRESTDV